MSYNLNGPRFFALDLTDEPPVRGVDPGYRRNPVHILFFPFDAGVHATPSVAVSRMDHAVQVWNRKLFDRAFFPPVDAVVELQRRRPVLNVVFPYEITSTHIENGQASLQFDYRVYRSEKG